MALARFWIWLFSSCMATTIPVGRWVIRTAESVVLTDWPPGPVERYTSTLKVLFLYLDLEFLGLGQYRNGGRRGVDPAL